MLDWLPDEPDVVLMSRTYVPENRGVGTLLSKNKDGLGVDRINGRSLKTASVESPKPNTTVNWTNGRGRVR